MYEIVREKYPEANSLAEKTSDILQKALNIKVTDSEKLYLMMHINRLSEKKN
ncbi:MAG: PRD domain-containing protein [Erysipelotrichaceae bacterium]|nr:PRD domain-containing protein [Erysipelotrichaceae bacterium]